MRRFFCLLLIVLALFSGVARAGALEDSAFAWTLRVTAENGVAAGAMCLPEEGGAYLAGFVEGAAACGEALGGKDGYIARVDADGQIAWQHRLGGSGDERFRQVIEGIGGGCLALGVTDSQDGQCRAARGGQDAFLARLDDAGELLWVKCLGGSSDDELLAVSLWEEGGYLVCGRSRSRNGDLGANYGGWDAWAMLLSEEDGKPQWVTRYGGSADDAFSLILPSYDHWLLIGTVGVELAAEAGETAVGGSLPMVVAVDSAGEIVWDQTLGGDGVSVLNAAHETESGWLLAGATNSTSALMPAGHGGMDLWVLQMRQSGTVSWQRTYGGSRDESFYALHMSEAGGYVYLAGTESTDGQVVGAHGEEDVWLVKATSTGAVEWRQAIGGGGWSVPAGLISDGRDGYLVAGSTVSQDGDIGAHFSMRSGFLAHLAANGNLLSCRLVGGEEEFSAVSLQRSGEGAYLLGRLRRAETTGILEELWLGKLLEPYEGTAD